MKASLDQALEWLIEQPDGQQHIQDNYFDRNVVQAANRFAKSDEFQAVLDTLKVVGSTPPKVLDLGAGRGIAGYGFAIMGNDVFAVEPNPSTFTGSRAIAELNKAANLQIKTVSAYGENLPFSNDSFDFVYARQVLHHAIDLDLLCREVYRILRPGGIFLITREHVIFDYKDLRKFLDSHLLHHLTREENAFLLKEYLSAIAKAGFHLEHIWGPYDTVMNYYPMPAHAIKSKVTQAFTPLIPTRVVRLAIRSNWVTKHLTHIVSLREITPGQLYSFQAIKKSAKQV